MCFYMYKRGDLRMKIDRVDSQKVKEAKRFYTILMQIKKDIIYHKTLLEQMQIEKRRKIQEEYERQMEEEKKRKDDEIRNKVYDPNPYKAQ